MASPPGNMTRVGLLSPQNFVHGPTQHVFLRFPDISLLDKHSFTVIASPAKSPTSNDSQTLSFLVRSHSGFTAKLSAYTSSMADHDTSAWLDGPYGGSFRSVERLHDSVLLIAGGTGISACLSWLLHFCNLPTSAMRTKHVELVWIMREGEHFEWAKDLLKLCKSPEGLEIKFSFFVTSTDVEEAKGTETSYALQATRNEDAIEKEVAVTTASTNPTSMTELGAVRHGRPTMARILGPFLGVNRGSSFIFGCGPNNLQTDLSNACATAQGLVIKGEIQELNVSGEFWMVGYESLNSIIL